MSLALHHEEVSAPAVSPGAIVARGTGVFSINFIRRDIVSLRVRRALAHLSLGYGVASGVLAVALLGMAAASHQQWRRLQITAQAIAPSAAALGQMKERLEPLYVRAHRELARLQMVAELQRQRFPVAGKLAALTTTLPARTWITQLVGDRQRRTLRIQAVYLLNAGAPYALPTKEWMDALRADPVFGQGLASLDLAASSHVQQGEAQLIHFELAAQWQPVGH